MLLIQQPTTAAQTDCGIADRLDFPFDRAAFTLVQGFAVPSMRHQGRYHTGEDWAAAPGATVGLPVLAIAAGRVTLADPRVWGLDGGVVIIEHTFEDGTTARSLYGHLTDEGVPFPPRYSCVTLGQPIGAIKNVRPAPHVHIEIRTDASDVPGGGYLRENPADNNYLALSAFIPNQQMWLRPSHVFHTRVAAGLQSDPLLLSDNSLLTLDNASVLRRVLPDGRILWRKDIVAGAVSVTAFQGQSLLTTRDGAWTVINIDDGSLGESWRITDFSPAGAPFVLNDWLVYPQANNALSIVDETRRTVLLTLVDVPAWVRAQVVLGSAAPLLGLLTADNNLVRISAAGFVLDSTALRYPASLAQGAGSDLLVYSWGGLWAIDNNGQWRAEFDAPRGATDGALWRDSQRTVLFDGVTVSAYDRTNALLWQTPISGVSGASRLVIADEFIWLFSTDGTIAAFNATGKLCNQAQVAPAQHPLEWQSFSSSDGVLRVALADHIIGLDSARFVAGC